MECIVHGSGGGLLRDVSPPTAIWSRRQPGFLFLFFSFCKNCATLEIYHLQRRVRRMQGDAGGRRGMQGHAGGQGRKVRLKGCLRLALLNGKPADGREPRLKLHHS